MDVEFYMFLPSIGKYINWDDEKLDLLLSDDALTKWKWQDDNKFLVLLFSNADKFEEWGSSWFGETSVKIELNEENNMMYSCIHVDSELEYLCYKDEQDKKYDYFGCFNYHNHLDYFTMDALHKYVGFEPIVVCLCDESVRLK